MTLPFFVMATSEVPAPISTKTRFKWRMVGGINTLMAAIGSSVTARRARPVETSAESMESMTCRGKKVAMMEAVAFSPRWPTRDFSWTPSSVYLIVL